MKAGHLGLWLLVCAGACQRPAPSTANSVSGEDAASEPRQAGDDSAVSEAAPDDAEGEAGSGEPSAAAGDGEQSEPVQDLAVVVACKRLCDRVEQLCDEAATKKCRTKCQGHVEQATGCEDQYQSAIRCQAKADKANLCADVTAPECAASFEEIQRCKRGEMEKSAPGPTLPTGWTRITDDKLGFTLALPAGAALDPAAPRRTWRAQDGAVEYYAAQLTTPGEAITSKVLLRLVLEFVGLQCQKNLRLHGQFEIGDEVAILFDATCKDGLEWHGMLRARPDQALATAFHAAPNAGGVTGPFFYSYKRLPR